MNVLIVGHFYTSAFGLHISETLNEMGHTTFHYEPGLKYRSRNSLIGKRWNSIKQTAYDEFLSKISIVQRFNARPLNAVISDHQIDLTIVLHDYLFPEEVKKIKNETKAPIVLWFPDPISNFKKSMFLLSDYDYYFFVDMYIVDTLNKDFKLNTRFLPQACFPKYHKPTDLTLSEKKVYGCDIGNVGNMNVNRIALYRMLREYNIKMWGGAPPYWVNDQQIKPMMQAKFVRHEEKAKAFRGAKIILNNLMASVINGVNKRVFEATACGAFVLMKYFPVLEELYDIDQEIAVYHNFDDMVKKIDYYLKHDDERKAIADAGMKRAHRDHSYEIRLKEMLSVIFD